MKTFLLACCAAMFMTTVAFAGHAVIAKSSPLSVIEQVCPCKPCDPKGPKCDFCEKHDLKCKREVK